MERVVVGGAVPLDQRRHALPVRLLLVAARPLQLLALGLLHLVRRLEYEDGAGERRVDEDEGGELVAVGDREDGGASSAESGLAGVSLTVQNPVDE